MAFCDGDGKPVAWLQPLQSITANGPHAVVIAPMLVSVEMFRVEQTYELIIARHEVRSARDGKAPFVFSQATFVGRHGHLSLELGGRDREAAGEMRASRGTGFTSKVESTWALAPIGTAKSSCSPAAIGRTCGLKQDSVSRRNCFAPLRTAQSCWRF